MSQEELFSQLKKQVSESDCSEESLAEILDTIYKLTHAIGSSPEEVEDLRLQLVDENRSYVSRMAYQK